MSSGGGSRQTTTIEGGTPLLVQDFIPRRQFRRMARYANVEGRRAQESLATAQEVANRVLARINPDAPRIYEPMRRPDGSVVEPFQAPRFMNAQRLVPTSRELRLPQSTDSSSSKTEETTNSQTERPQTPEERLAAAARSSSRRNLLS